jgi:CheY-like chemotaxis protein
MLHGYDMGCDDYVTKPFSLKELYAKVQALGDNGKYLKTVVSKGYIITERI